MDKDLIKLIKEVNINEYRSIPFWSWNDKLEKEELINQIKWMKEQGFGGYFMHARGGLMTEYLGEEWFDCIEACLDEGDKLNMGSWIYDENGWPSGFAGGKVIEDVNNCDKLLTTKTGEYDGAAMVSYLIDGENLVRTTEGGKGEYLNVYQQFSMVTADILNPKVVDKFIELTHAEYEKRFKDKFYNKLQGFFTDEPQYFRWGQPYTDMIAEYFKEEYKEDILDGLGLLFTEKEGYKAFRYKYYKGMQALLLKNYSKKVYDWCEERGVQFTGHYIEERNLAYQVLCCGGVMPFYEYEHIPGIDHLGADLMTSAIPKQVSSVARQVGKKRVLTETFACCGWGVTAKQTKRIAEWQYVNGVNLMCQHLLPYSEHGQRKRDYPAHYSWANPWVREDFKTFNDYFARLGYLLAESEEPVSVALFCPVRSVYFDYKRTEFNQNTPADLSYVQTADELSRLNIPYHIIDETVMAKHGRVEGNSLIVGNCHYDYIVFPTTYTMDKSTYKLMEEFFAGGGKMLFKGEIPTYLEGEKHEYNFYTNTNIDEILSAQPYTISDRQTEIQSTLRVIEGKKYIYAVNLSEDKAYTITFNGDFNGFTALDLEKLSTKKMSKTITFDPGESYVLFLSEDACDYIPPQKEIVLDGEFKVVNSSGNYMLLDKLEYSLDGKTYSDKMRYMGVFQELLKKRYNGEVYLRYTFESKILPKTIDLLAEDLHTEWCKVNGKIVEFNGVSDFEKQLYRANVADCVKLGNNEIIFKINFYESEDVYTVMFGTSGTESLKNKLAYDTTIEACYLQGDFGVYAKQPFRKGEKKNVFITDEFYIDSKKEVVVNTLTDGYPFFAGNMTLEKEFRNDGRKLLNLKGNFCLSKVKINGVVTEKSYFSDKVSLEGLLKDGVNTATITLWSGNRNLLGPHHYLLDEDPRGVGPYTFELNGTWEKGVSSEERPDYALVRFGLFDGE